MEVGGSSGQGSNARKPRGLYLPWVEWGAAIMGNTKCLELSYGKKGAIQGFSVFPFQQEKHCPHLLHIYYLFIPSMRNNGDTGIRLTLCSALETH